MSGVVSASPKTCQRDRAAGVVARRLRGKRLTRCRRLCGAFIR